MLIIEGELNNGEIKMKKKIAKTKKNVTFEEMEEAPGDKRMNMAYKASKKLVYTRLEDEDRENIRIIENLDDSDIIVIMGVYDHIHHVLTHLNMPFKMVEHYELNSIQLRPDQTVFVNCPSAFDLTAARKLRTFVEQGGQLITTDWGLKHVLEPAFPEMVKFNGQPTSDEVVRIELIDGEDELVKGFLDEKSDPVWWLEGSSYPIEILNKEKVKVLIRSKELGEKYNANPVMIRFEWGKGVVYHMISHLYLQRTETRDQKQSMAKEEYLKEKLANPAAYQAVAEELDEMEISYGEMQSASSTVEFASRAILNQKKKFKGKKK